MSEIRATSCVAHSEHTAIFPMFADYLRLTENHAQAAALWVLEVHTNRRIARLSRERREVQEDWLWLDLSYHDFAAASLYTYASRTFQEALLALEQAGLVDVRFVKCDQAGRLVSDEAGSPYVYVTYRDAQADLAHHGAILKQYRLRYEEVNRVLARQEEDHPGPRGGNLPNQESSPAPDDTPVPYAKATRGH